MNEINAKRREHFTNLLNKLDDILDRIISRRDKAVDRGLDAASADTGIAAARKAIDAARAVVAEQVGKTYPITITDENVILRDNVKTAKNLLQGDLEKIRDALQAARDTVHRAAVTLAQISRVDDDNAPPATTTTSTTAQ